MLNLQVRKLDLRFCDLPKVTHLIHMETKTWRQVYTFFLTNFLAIPVWEQVVILRSTIGRELPDHVPSPSSFHPPPFPTHLPPFSSLSTSPFFLRVGTLQEWKSWTSPFCSYPKTAHTPQHPQVAFRSLKTSAGHVHVIHIVLFLAASFFIRIHSKEYYNI